MKAKKLTFLVLFLFSLVFMVGLVSATTTLVVPSTGDNFTATIALVNCTTDVVKALTAAIWYNATGVSNAILTTINNDTEGDTMFNESSISVSSFTDVADYNFWCSIVGDTSENSSVNANITIDNTNPTVSVSTSKKEVERASFATLSWTITDGIDSSPIESCTVTTSGGDTITASSSPYTLTGTNTRQIGMYTFSCIGTDYTGNSATSSVTFRVSTDEDVVGGEGIKSRGSAFVFLIIISTIVALIFIIMLTFTLMRKKK